MSCLVAQAALPASGSFGAAQLFFSFNGPFSYDVQSDNSSVKIIFKNSSLDTIKKSLHGMRQKDDVIKEMSIEQEGGGNVVVTCFLSEGDIAITCKKFSRVRHLVVDITRNCMLSPKDSQELLSYTGSVFASA